MPEVLLVGAANAGKSALFSKLTGASALVSATPVPPVIGWMQVGSFRPGAPCAWSIPLDGCRLQRHLDQAAIELGQQRPFIGSHDPVLFNA